MSFTNAHLDFHMLPHPTHCRTPRGMSVPEFLVASPSLGDVPVPDLCLALLAITMSAMTTIARIMLTIVGSMTSGSPWCCVLWASLCDSLRRLTQVTDSNRLASTSRPQRSHQLRLLLRRGTTLTCHILLSLAQRESQTRVTLLSRHRHKSAAGGSCHSSYNPVLSLQRVPSGVSTTT